MYSEKSLKLLINVKASKPKVSSRNNAAKTRHLKQGKIISTHKVVEGGNISQGMT
jgi:hypothetical protein